MRRPSDSTATARRSARLALWISAIVMAFGCASTPPRFSGEIVWEADDRRPIPKPEEREGTKIWDGVDQVLFRPLSHVFLLQDDEPALNVNALGHVPNSSWYTNRLSRWRISPERVVLGPCDQLEMPDYKRWVIQGGKVEGNNPGFVIDAVDEQGASTRYLIKFDGPHQTERATAADVIGSKVYWAAGFAVPCNRIVHFDRDVLELADDATRKDATGRKIPLTDADIQRAMSHAPRLPDGRVRAMASEFLPGEPLGPFSYTGVRSDDPNDVIPHQRRRELRGSRLVAAWINHFDTREQNTYTSYIRPGPDQKGYVQHFYLDLGDSLGSRWFSDGMTRRIGHSYFVDFGDMLTDLLTLGAIPRPWTRVEVSEVSQLFAYFDVHFFDPETWKPGLPNPTLNAMDARDAFWATLILSRFSDEHIDRLVEAGKFSEPTDARYLKAMLVGRRDRIISTYFKRMSPLVAPEVDSGRLCVRDAWVAGNFGAARDAFYETRISRTGRSEADEPTWQVLDATAEANGRICIGLPDPNAIDRADGDLIVSWQVRRVGQRDPAEPTRFFLRADQKRDRFRIVGILRQGERP